MNINTRDQKAFALLLILMTAIVSTMYVFQMDDIGDFTSSATLGGGKKPAYRFAVEAQGQKVIGYSVQLSGFASHKNAILEDRGNGNYVLNDAYGDILRLKRYYSHDNGVYIYDLQTVMDLFSGRSLLIQFDGFGKITAVELFDKFGNYIVDPNYDSLKQRIMRTELGSFNIQRRVTIGYDGVETSTIGRYVEAGAPLEQTEIEPVVVEASTFPAEENALDFEVPVQQPESRKNLLAAFVILVGVAVYFTSSRFRK